MYIDMPRNTYPETSIDTPHIERHLLDVHLDMWHAVQTCGMLCRDVHRDTRIERVVETSMHLLDVCLDSIDVSTTLSDMHLLDVCLDTMPHVYSHSMPQA